MSERDLELREKSGAVSTTDPLAVLLYVLVKDYLTAKQMEEVLDKVQATMPGTVVFNNGWIGKYALELKDKLGQLREDQAVGTVPASTGGIRAFGGMTELKPYVSPTESSGGMSIDSKGNVTYWNAPPKPEDFEITTPDTAVLEEADVVLSQLQKTLPPAEFERVKQDFKDYELEQAFEGLMRKEDDGRKS